MACPICGEKIDPCKTVMIVFKDGEPNEISHIQCWWTRQIRLKKLADEEKELFGFAISTEQRPKGQA